MKQDFNATKSSTAYTARLHWAALGAAGLVAISGCSDATDKGPSGAPATQICDGALDKAAADSLRHLAGTDEFTELTGTTDANEPYKFSVERAAAHLHDQLEKRSRCILYKAEDKSGHPLIEMDFEAISDYPDQADAPKGGSKGQIIYPMGVFAVTNGNYGASLFFQCSTKGTKGLTQYVKASMFSSGDQLEGNSTSKDRMTILNSVSRHLAAQLSCSDKAKLPSGVPEPEDQ